MSILLQMIGLVTAYLLASWLMTFLPGWVLMGGLLAFYFCLLALPAIRLEEHHVRQ